MFGGYCGNYEVFTDTSYLVKKEPDRCFEPSLHGGLDNLYHFHPNSTVVLTVRDVNDWVSSINHFGGLGGHVKEKCRNFFPWQPNTVTDDDLARFYRDHIEFVRGFMREHPSLTYLEVSLESEETGTIMENHFGISRKCWGRSNENKKVRRGGK
ncbi:expressed unknown protein [Seminavis robusta]|uniref:Sulfotransferase n=1 Tax=Seminavis robusta TaxID=568900 RepID=A0A9N8ELE0_9STRA|nr:expressed unknown protein [Seminavis robusta]|eukprot:Sro1123_g243710.1 n/a (154) ;mRNA; r:30358-30819